MPAPVTASAANSIADVTSTRRLRAAGAAPMIRLCFIFCSLLFSGPARAPVRGSGGRRICHPPRAGRSRDRRSCAGLSSASPEPLVMAKGGALDEHERVAVDDRGELGALADQGGHALQRVPGQRPDWAAGG